MAGFVLGPGEGPVHEFHGSVVVIKASGEDTLGQLGVMEFSYPPGLLVHPYVHDGEDEMFYLLAGELTGFAVTASGRRGRAALCSFLATSCTASPSPAVNPPRLWSSPGRPSLTARSRRAEHPPIPRAPQATRPVPSLHSDAITISRRKEPAHARNGAVHHRGR